ncbi:MAG: class I SAM-dependent methyltransferase, partial [Anaerolineae bacterium]|nr:class I SAM-dependent methyltransferase [Anaerolineae bacterium]
MNDPTDLNTPTYERTRRAWRDIWTGTEFEREMATLDYPRARQLFDLYLPWLPKDPAAPILEAGCGPGHVVYYLRQRGYPALGLDYAPEALAPTRALYPDLPLHVGDVHQLPYPDNTFGAYLSFGVVEHFEQGPARALAEAFRTLRPGGVLVLSTPTPNVVEALLDLR